MLKKGPKMSEFLLNYLPILILFGIALALSVVFLLVPLLVAPAEADT